MWQARRVSLEPSAPDPTALLVGELGRKTGVCWIRHDGRTQPVWHVWVEDALAIVSGGDEQPFPDVEDGGRVEVVMRSADTGGRLVTWVGRASVVLPDDERWAATTAALVASRLNLPDVAAAPEVWAQNSVVRRVLSTGDFVEVPHEDGFDRPGSLQPSKEAG